MAKRQNPDPRDQTPNLQAANQAKETQAADVSQQVPAVGELTEAHAPNRMLERALNETRYLQNGAYSRDRTPLSIAIKQYYLQLKTCREELDFDEAGVGVYSQNNEDGILLYIFSKIGMTTKRSVEIGCDVTGSTVGIPEGNSINLIVNMAFDGLIIDRDANHVGAIRHFFAQALPTKHYHSPAQVDTPAHYFSPAVVAREVSAENVNALLEEAGFAGELDLLSIDVDGPDLEIWKAIKVANPRVVIIEVNNRLPFDQLIYDHETRSNMPPDTLEYQASSGSSLAAVCMVAEEKGYIFIGMGTTLINAFFVRRDAWHFARRDGWRPELPERRPEEYLEHRMNPMRVRAKA